jgi:ABC-2 type transport system permease protein
MTPPANTAAAPPAYRMKGPSAFSGPWRRFASLALILARTDYKVRFYGSALGWMWGLVRPLLLFGVLYAVFSQIVRVGKGVEFYPVVLLTGIMLYFYFQEATTRSVDCVVDREQVVRKIHFPRMVIPLAVTLTATFNLLMSFIAIFVFMALSGVSVEWSWLELPFLLALLFLFSYGVSMLLSALFVPFRDVRPIWEVVTQALFYATPILYPIELLADRSKTLAHIAMCNPLAAIIQQVRHAVIDHSAPSAADAIGGAVYLLIPLGILIGVFVLGLWVFNRLAPTIAEEL